MSGPVIRGTAVLRRLLEDQCFDVRQLDAAGFREWLERHLAHWFRDPVFAQRIAIRNLRRAHPDLLQLEREDRRAVAADAAAASHVQLQRVGKAIADAGEAITGLTAAIEKAAPDQRTKLEQKLESFRTQRDSRRLEQQALIAASPERQDRLRIRGELDHLRTATGLSDAEATLAAFQRERGQRSGRAGDSFEQQANHLIHSLIVPEVRARSESESLPLHPAAPLSTTHPPPKGPTPERGQSPNRNSPLGRGQSLNANGRGQSLNRNSQERKGSEPESAPKGSEPGRKGSEPEQEPERKGSEPRPKGSELSPIELSPVLRPGAPLSTTHPPPKGPTPERGQSPNRNSPLGGGQSPDRSERKGSEPERRKGSELEQEGSERKGSEPKPKGSEPVSGADVRVLRGVTLGAARMELDGLVIRQPARDGEPVEVLAIVEAKRNINDLAHGFRHRQENLAWLTGDASGYQPHAYRTRVFTSGHFDHPAVHRQEDQRFIFTRDSFWRFRRDSASSLFFDALYLVTRPGPMWGLSRAAMNRLSYRVATDPAWDPDDAEAVDRLLRWCHRLTHEIETPDVLRMYASTEQRAGQILFAVEPPP